MKHRRPWILGVSAAAIVSAILLFVAIWNENRGGGASDPQFESAEPPPAPIPQQPALVPDSSKRSALGEPDDGSSDEPPEPDETIDPDEMRLFIAGLAREWVPSESGPASADIPPLVAILPPKQPDPLDDDPREPEKTPPHTPPLTAGLPPKQPDPLDDDPREPEKTPTDTPPLTADGLPTQPDPLDDDPREPEKTPTDTPPLAADAPPAQPDPPDDDPREPEKTPTDTPPLAADGLPTQPDPPDDDPREPEKTPTDTPPLAADAPPTQPDPPDDDPREPEKTPLPDTPALEAPPSIELSAQVMGDLTVFPPASGAYYRSLVNMDGLAPGFTNLKWLSKATGGSGSIVIREDGAFSFTVSTHGYQGVLDILVFGDDSQGNRREAAFELYNDGVGPSMLITSPREGDYFASSVEVSGRLGPGPLDPEGVGEIQALRWSLEGGEPRTAIFDEDGGFSFFVSTTDYTDRVNLTITAVDLNNNETRRTFSLIDSRLTPELTINYPLDGMEYGAGIFLQGRVTDPYRGRGDLAGLESVQYELLASDSPTRDGIVVDDIVVAADGTFSVPILTRDFMGQQELTVIVTGRNGRQSVQTIRLRQGRSAIPDFNISSTDSAVNARWGAIPTATGYEVNVVDARGLSVRYLADTTATLVSGLVNGQEYRFRVRATLPSGLVESREILSIPLSDNTLKPAVSGAFRRIRVSWNEIPGADAYTIYRSRFADGPFEVIAEAVSGGEYLDANVGLGQRYWYAIAPAAYADRLSAPTSALTLLSQNNNLERIAGMSAIRPESIAISGEYAFVVSPDKGLTLLDISDVGQPVDVGLSEIPGALDVALSESYAYIVTGSAGLKVVNIENPSWPIQVGSSFAGDAVSIETDGRYAFVADAQRGLRVLDISRPNRPSRVAVTAGISGRDVLVSGEYAFLAAADGVHVFDISLPSSPRLLSMIPSSNAESLVFQDDALYVGGSQSGVSIYDVADPADPVLLSRIDSLEVLAMERSEAFLLLTTPNRLLLVDVRNPEEPFIFQTFPVSASSMAVHDDKLLIASRGGLDLYQTYFIGTSYITGDVAVDGRVYRLSAANGRLYVSAHAGGVSVVNSSTLSRESGYSTLFAEGAAMGNTNIYVADGPGGIRVIRPDGGDIVFEGFGYAHDVIFLNGIVYAATEEGLMVLEEVEGVVRNLGMVPFPECRTLHSDGSLIFAGGGDELRVFAPVPGTIPSESHRVRVEKIRDVTVQDGEVITVNHLETRLWRLENNRSLNSIGQIALADIQSVAFDGRYAYLSAGHRGLLIYDVRDPEEPELVSSCREVFALDAVIDNGTAYVVDGTGVKRITVAVPSWLR